MGTLYVVATPIGNLNDITKRAIDTLREVDLILVEDTRQTIKLLNHFDIKNKMESYHKFNETKKGLEVIEKLKEGKNIALVSDAGTPCISDPGYILVNIARKENIEVLVVPGASAVISALSISGLDTKNFSFYGFVHTDNKEKEELFHRIKTSDIETKVLYESPKRIVKLLEYINKVLPNSYIYLANELTKMHESSTYGNISDVYEKVKDDPNYLKGEYVVVLSNKKEEEKENALSLEALIIDEVVKNNCSIKDAVSIVNEKNKDISKKDIYNAGLNLKNIIK